MRVGQWVETRHRYSSPAPSNPGRSCGPAGEIIVISPFEMVTDELPPDSGTPTRNSRSLEGESGARIRAFCNNISPPQAQRDLCIAMRDLFFRQSRLSIDQVERLKKRVESTQVKLSSITDAQKDGWDNEAKKLVQTIETDQTTIVAQLNRRVYIRAW